MKKEGIKTFFLGYCLEVRKRLLPLRSQMKVKRVREFRKRRFGKIFLVRSLDIRKKVQTFAGRKRESKWV